MDQAKTKAAARLQFIGSSASLPPHYRGTYSRLLDVRGYCQDIVTGPDFGESNPRSDNKNQVFILDVYEEVSA